MGDMAEPLFDPTFDLSEGMESLTTAQLELAALIADLKHELAGSLDHWDAHGRRTLAEAEAAWASAQERQRDIVADIPHQLHL